MKKMFVTAVSALIVGLFLGSVCYADWIDLDSPEDRPDITRAIVDDVSDHPDQEALSFRVSLQYQKPGGEWVEGRDFSRVVVNTPAVVDDPNTPEDETQPASPQYTNLMNLVVSGGKSIERIILERMERVPRFNGTISTVDGELVLILTTPIARPDVSRMVVGRISDRPRAKKIVIIGLMIYRESGEWKRHRRVRVSLEDITDDINTSEDETSTAYSDFMTTLRSGGKTLNQRALDELIKTYPGTIQ